MKATRDAAPNADAPLVEYSIASSWPCWVFGLAAGVAFLVKLGLAWASPGTRDVATFRHFGEVLSQSGGLSVYRQPLKVDAAFNYLPFMLHFVHIVRFLSQTTHWSFAFCLRLMSIVADVGSAWILWRVIVLRAARGQATPHAAFLLYLMAPVTLWVSGFHGNTDAVMLFFLLLSLHWLYEERPAWLVGVAFGLSLNIKLMPLALAPLCLMFLGTPRRRIEYSIAVVLTVFCGGLPYLWQDPSFILHRAMSYNGLYGIWGISRLMRALPRDWTAPDFLFQHFGRFLLLGALLFWTFRLKRWRCRLDLWEQSAVLMLLFLILTPAFGIQYLLWLAPFVLFLDFAAAVMFNLVAGCFLSLNYVLIWLGYPIEAWPPPLPSQMLVVLGIICWCVLLLLFRVETRRLMRREHASALIA